MISTTAEYPIARLRGELDPDDHVSLREPMMHWEALALLIAGAAVYTFG